MGKIRVALAEDHVLLREGIARLVAANEDFELVGRPPTCRSCSPSSASRSLTWW